MQRERRESVLDKRLSNTHPERGRGESRGPERVRRIVEEEMRILREKAKLLSDGLLVEKYTAYLGLRVRPTIKQLWEAAPLEAKRSAKQALEATILAYYLGGQASLGTHLYGAPPVIMNLNIVEARAEAGAEARAEARADLEPLARLLEELLRELHVIRNLAAYPSRANAEAISRKAEAMIDRVREARRRLEFN